MTKTLILAAALAAAIAAPAAAEPAAGNDSSHACLEIGRIWSWHAPNNRTLIVENDTHHKFKLDLMGYCPSLTFKETLGFRSIGGSYLSCITPGDVVFFHDIGTETRCGAGVVPAFLADDREGFDLVVDNCPPLAVVRDAARVLLRDAALAGVRLAIHRPAGDIDVRRAWEDCHPSLAATLARLHGFAPGDLLDWLEWAGSALLEDDCWIPSHDQARHLALTLSLIAEMFCGHGQQEWQHFLLVRTAGEVMP